MISMSKKNPKSSPFPDAFQRIKESIRLFVISGRLITRKMPSDARTGEKRFPAGTEKHLSVQIQDKIHLTLYRQVLSGSP